MRGGRHKTAKAGRRRMTFRGVRWANPGMARRCVEICQSACCFLGADVVEVQQRIRQLAEVAGGVVEAPRSQGTVSTIAGMDAGIVCECGEKTCPADPSYKYGRAGKQPTSHFSSQRAHHADVSRHARHDMYPQTGRNDMGTAASSNQGVISERSTACRPPSRLRTLPSKARPAPECIGIGLPPLSVSKDHGNWALGPRVSGLATGSQLSSQPRTGRPCAIERWPF
ncbi:hypothetical protein B0T14DRAFT_41151 [Immersiella caudata]|uniref:Uncharacterized protein n=1 Tax=Immersiella caudata TaxID=314043 RepID=A0AA39XEY7_9PEZI|nr:hypothetical protein B0T14DRAFT_41151 [Immersiella caudata]